MKNEYLHVSEVWYLFGICNSLMLNTCMNEKVPLRKLVESFMLTVCVRYQHNSYAEMEL